MDLLLRVEDLAAQRAAEAQSATLPQGLNMRLAEGFEEFALFVLTTLSRHAFEELNMTDRLVVWQRKASDRSVVWP